MFNIIVKARVFVGGLLSAGLHVVKITEVAETTSKPSDNWEDQTPQLEVKFENEEGNKITHWFQLKGFMQQKDYPKGIAPKGVEFRSSENGDENYAVDKATGERIEDEAKTATCNTIVSEFTANCGIKEGTKINSLNALIKAISNAEVGIMVRKRADNKVEYHYSKPASEVTVEEDAEA